jgi:hypothetical protein
MRYGVLGSDSGGVCLEVLGMKTRTVIERIGEWLGPVDWDYNFNQHAWSKSHGGVNPECIKKGKELLRKASEDPEDWFYSPCQFGAHKVLNIGMYDGWPFWKPTPAIGFRSVLGGEDIAFFYNLNEGNFFQKRKTCSCGSERFTTRLVGDEEYTACEDCGREVVDET